jgi:hypothetical protein
MGFIQNWSPLIRWILVPIVFVACSSLVHGSVIIFSLVLSIFWGQDHADLDLWIYKIIIANILSAYCASYFSGWTAPRYKLTITCVGASVYLLGNLFIVYGMFTSDNWWGVDTIFSTLSTSIGVIIAIWMAKTNFH